MRRGAHKNGRVAFPDNFEGTLWTRNFMGAGGDSYSCMIYSVWLGVENWGLKQQFLTEYVCVGGGGGLKGQGSQ